MKKGNIKRKIDNTLSKSLFNQIKLLLAVVFSVFVLLIVIRLLFNLFFNFATSTDLCDWVLHFINPANFFDSSTDVADKYWALVIGSIGMFCLSGLLIPVINNAIARRVEKVQNGQVYYRFENHVIIIGYNRLCTGLIQQLTGKYPGVNIVLQTVREVPKIRHELFSNLKSKNENSIILVSGNRTFEEDLRKLNLDRCKEIFILGETEEEDNDSLNIICLKKIDHILQESPKTVRCNVLLQYQSTFAIFQQQDVEINSSIDFVPFNCHEAWARKVLVERKYQDIEYVPLDHDPVTAGSDNRVHLVIVGMSSMGVALGIQAAHLCHFPNFITKGIKTRITFIDEYADREMNFLMGRYRHLFNETDYCYRDLDDEKKIVDNRSSKIKFTDIEFEFIKSRIENPKMQEEIAQWSLDGHSCLTIAVCFSFSPASIAAGLYLPDEVYERKIPVLVRQVLSDYTLLMFSQKNQNDLRKYENVKPFGMLDNCYDLKRADDRLPMIINYIYKKAADDNFEIAALSLDPIEEEWKELTTALKWSNRYCANSVYVKKRSFNIHPDTALTAEQINLLAQVEHNRWNTEKLLMGYRATTPEEAEEIATGRQTKKYYKDRFIHNDIREYQTLTEDDNGIHVSRYDVNIAKSLPFMLKELDQ